MRMRMFMWLVSVVKMATVLEVCTTEEQRTLVRVFVVGRNDSMRRIFIKKCFLFTTGSVCHVKLFTTGSRNSLKDVQKSQIMPDEVALFRLRQKQLRS
jgi:hypothetical protein